MDIPLPVAWITDPDKVTFAIWALAGAVVVLGGMLIAGGKWIAGFIINSATTRLTSLEDKLDRVAVSLETLTLTTSLRISNIETVCRYNHANHQRASDPPTGV